MMEKGSTGEESLLNMQNIEIFIHKSFVKKFLILGCVKTGKWFWISVREPVFCQETCILTEQSGLAQIFRKNKSSRHRSYLRAWILGTM